MIRRRGRAETEEGKGDRRRRLGEVIMKDNKSPKKSKRKRKEKDWRVMMKMKTNVLPPKPHTYWNDNYTALVKESAEQAVRSS